MEREKQNYYFMQTTAVVRTKIYALMQYLAWRTVVTRHNTIQISFMIPGHTKFEPDRFFGVFKKKF